MSLGRVARGATVAALAASAVLAAPVSAPAQRAVGKGAAPAASKGSGGAERASGVITKVERVTKGATPGSTIEKESAAGRARPASYRLTINTNAVWRDWARDQAAFKDRGPAKDAAKGRNSVATLGEPADPNSLVVVDVGPETRVETRFRAADDETGKGTARPENARTNAAKPVRFHADDLKAGLFVEVDFRHVTAQNPASAVAVIRPIGGPEDSAKAGAVDPAKGAK